MLSPIGTKIGNQIHLKAISSGMMFASLYRCRIAFLNLCQSAHNMDLYDPQTANIFVRFWQLGKTLPLQTELLTAPYNMTMGIFGLICAFGIAYSLAREYKLDATMNGMISGDFYACGYKQCRWANFN
jgi:PTS system cellobiose-specific IIC component